MLQRVRLLCDFNCSYKLAQKNNPNCSKIMSLFRCFISFSFLPILSNLMFSLFTLLLFGLCFLTAGEWLSFGDVRSHPLTHTSPSWGSKLRIRNWISALQEHRVIGIEVWSKAPRSPGWGHCSLLAWFQSIHLGFSLCP